MVVAVVRPVYGTNCGVDWSTGGRPAAARAALRSVCARSSITTADGCEITGSGDGDDDAAAADFEEEERSMSPIVLLMGVVSEATRGSDGEHDGRVRLLLLLLLRFVPVDEEEVRSS